MRVHDVECRAVRTAKRAERLDSESLPVVVITGNADTDAEETGIAQGAVAFLRKRFDDEALLVAVQESVS